MNSYEEALVEHRRRMRTDITYRLQEQLEDFRVDMIPGRWTDDSYSVPMPENLTVTHDSESQWNKKQWDVVNQLRLEQKNIRNLIYKTLKEKKEKYTSKRRYKYEK